MPLDSNDPVANIMEFIRSGPDKKAETARINGAKSKGPITPEGKDKSSANAIRHGLTANKHVLLFTEFADEYEEVYQAFVADLRPQTKAELRLVQKIANLDWRLERLVMIETCALNLEAGVRCHEIASRFSNIDGIGFIFEAWKGSCNTSHCLDLLRRYMSTLQSQFNSTLNNFLKFEKRRLARVVAGRDLDQESAPPYDPPVFKTHIPSMMAPSIHLINPFPNEPTPEPPPSQFSGPPVYPAA
jgi:hypothetical protein